jgi:hypothetical protein
MPPKNLLISELRAAAYEGVEGETLFHKPYLNVLLSEEHEKTNALLDRLGAHKDDRSWALMAALVCEANLDRMLSAIYPRYEKDFVPSRTVFDLKIKLLQAQCLIPFFITQAASLVKDVRNEFAHKLDIDTLDDVSERTQGHLRSYYDERYRGTRIAHQRRDLREVFATVVEHATVSLIAYYINLQDYVSVTRRPAFAKDLDAQAEHRTSVLIRALMEHGRQMTEEPPSETF